MIAGPSHQARKAELSSSKKALLIRPRGSRGLAGPMGRAMLRYRSIVDCMGKYSTGNGAQWLPLVSLSLVPDTEQNDELQQRRLTKAYVTD